MSDQPIENEVGGFEDEGTSHEESTPNRLGCPPLKKRSRQSAGPLARRLQRLRETRKLDSLRLSSGQYHYSDSYHINDPRNGKSACDVTVLGEPHFGREWVTSLVFLHTIERYGWLSLSTETSRALKLRVGLHLRVYDGITFPSSHRDRLQVVCTYICETYPEDLPSLPSADSLREKDVAHHTSPS